MEAAIEGANRRMEIVAGMVVDPDGRSVVLVEGIPDFLKYHQSSPLQTVPLPTQAEGHGSFLDSLRKGLEDQGVIDLRKKDSKDNPSPGA
jgi:predicted glycosyltransferase